MRFIILFALCLAVASATKTNNNRLNRLVRSMHQQQQQQQQNQYGNQGGMYGDDDEESSQDEDQDDDTQQQQCQGGQGGQGQGCDDEENQYGSSDEDEQDEQQGQQQNWQGQGNNQNWQGQGNNQQQKQKQQKHQCQPKQQLLQNLEQPNGQLAAKLYKQAKQENDDKNTVVAPAALQLALAAIQKGARGNTKRQIQRITSAGLNQKQSQQAHSALKQALQGKNQKQQGGQQQNAQVKATTTIVIKQQSKAQQQFAEAAQACFNAQVKKCNFQQQPKQCGQQINQHVAQKTNQKLKKAVPQDAITSNTKMVVVNTAQLKAKWGKQFQNQQTTKQGNFYPLGSQQSKRVQVLQSQGKFNYYEDEQLQVVGVPTQQQELTLYVIVPKDKDGLNQVEKQQIQNGQQLKELLNSADQNKQQVQVQLPKFQIKHKIDAKQTLVQQGAKNAFDADDADFSGITGQQQQQQQQQNWNKQQQQQQQQDENDEDDQGDQDQDNQDQQKGQQLHLNKLIHQATIKVNEQGITSAQSGDQQNQQQGQGQGQNNQDDDDEDNDSDDEDNNNNQQQQWDQQEYGQQVFGKRQRGQQGGQQQGQSGGKKQVKANHAFAFAVKHNKSNQIVLVGRVVDASQKPQNQQQGQQTINGVDQQ